MKSYISGFVTCLILCLSVTAFAAGSLPGIKTAVYTDKVVIEVDGQKQDVEVISVVKENEDWPRNYVAIGDIAPVLGAQVNWNGERQAVEIKTAIPPNIDIEKERDNGDWIKTKDLWEQYGKGMTSKERIYYIYDDNSYETLLTTINLDGDEKIRVKIEDDWTYFNKSDLIREGIITE